MPIYRLQTSIQDKSGLPRDQYVSTLFVAPIDGVATIDDVGACCAAVAGFHIAFGPHYSPGVNRTGHNVRGYLVVRPPNDAPPLVTSTFEFNQGPTGGPIPAECAICLSFHAARQTGIVPQSTRGRIFMGPLDDTVVQPVAATGATQITSSVQTELNAAAEAMNNAFRAVGMQWVVYSRTQDKGYPVINVSVDNEFDTVRSRGKRATSNVIYPLTQPGSNVPIVR